jgi:hypothetical protein
VAAALPSVLDKAWVTMGGGPADLFFPDEFLGEWEVASTLVKVDLPCGPEFVPDLRVRPSSSPLPPLLCSVTAWPRGKISAPSAWLWERMSLLLLLGLGLKFLCSFSLALG